MIYVLCLLKSPWAPWLQFGADQIHAVSHALAFFKVNIWAGQETKDQQQGFADRCGNCQAIAITKD